MIYSKKRWYHSSKYVILPLLSLSVLHPSASEAAGTSTYSATIQTQAAGSAIAVENQKGPELRNVKFSKEQAIEKLKTLFPLLIKAEVQSVELGNSHMYPQPDNQMVWNIDWRFQEGNSSFGTSSMVDAVTGDLINMSLNFLPGEVEGAYYPPKVTREEAAALAKSFITKAVSHLQVDQLVQKDDPSLFNNSPLFGPVAYSFNFQPTQNGIPLPNSLFISVNGNGTITTFYRQPSTTNYPDVKPKITLEEANKRYKEHLNLSLQYIPLRKGNDTSFFLGWKPDNPYDLTIDALSGEYLSPLGKPQKTEDWLYRDVPKTSPAFIQATKSITDEEAAAKVLQIVKIPAGKTLQGKSLEGYRGNQELQVWNLSWRNPNDPFYGPEGEAFASVDVKTGQILEYRQDRFPRPASQGTVEKPTISSEAATQKAMQLINQLFPDASTQLKWTNQEAYKGLGTAFHFQFSRLFQGKPVNGDFASIGLDSSGNLIEYETNWTNDLQKKVQGLTSKISDKEAIAKYLAGTEMKLQYVDFNRFASPGEKQENTAKLVYQQGFKDELNSGYVIDARDGQWKSGWYANAGITMTKAPVDIKGNAAEQELETLVQHGILIPDESGQVKPEQTISQGEWLMMMVKAVNPNFEQGGWGEQEDIPYADVKKDSPYYSAVRSAFLWKWIEPGEQNLHAEEALTREGLADSLTHILHYNHLAQFMKTNLHSLKDFDQIKNQGNVEITQFLGLLPSKDGKFDPKGKVTRAQAASVIMKLVRLQGSIDQSISSDTPRY